MIDAALVFSDAQAVTTSAASSNYVDQGATSGNSEFGNGYLVVTTAVALATGTSIQATLQHDTSSAFGGVTDLVSGPVLTTATVTAVGSPILVVKIPPNSKRYLRVYYTIVGTYDTGSAVDAYITLTPPIVFK